MPCHTLLLSLHATDFYVCVFSSVSQPTATLQFDAELHFLHGSPTIRKNYQAVIHAGPIRQMAKLVRMDACEHHKTTDANKSHALCRFEFMYWPEYIRPDLPLVLREGSAHAVGKVVRAVHLAPKEPPPPPVVRSC